MTDENPTKIERLLGRLIAARGRRDGEPRFSPSWHLVDAEMRDIERAIFRLGAQPAPSRAAAGTPATSRARGDAPPSGSRRRRSSDDDREEFPSRGRATLRE